MRHSSNTANINDSDAIALGLTITPRVLALLRWTWAIRVAIQERPGDCEGLSVQFARPPSPLRVADEAPAVFLVRPAAPPARRTYCLRERRINGRRSREASTNSQGQAYCLPPKAVEIDWAPVKLHKRPRPEPAGTGPTIVEGHVGQSVTMQARPGARPMNCGLVAVRWLSRLVGRVGIEPTTPGLKVRCSAS